jgi:hypothetical protein
MEYVGFCAEIHSAFRLRRFQICYLSIAKIQKRPFTDFVQFSAIFDQFSAILTSFKNFGQFSAIMTYFGQF